jgi:hypothetical protein
MHKKLQATACALLLAVGPTLLPGGEVAAAESFAAADACECLGRYRFVGGEGQRAAVLRAVDEVVDDMSFLVRGIARARLRRATAIAQTMAISRDGTRVTVTIDGRSYATPRDGEVVEVVTATGDEVRLTHRHRGPQLDQRFQGDDGGRTNVYRCEGDQLVLDVVIDSPRLPREIRYSLTYARS